MHHPVRDPDRPPVPDSHQAGVRDCQRSPVQDGIITQPPYIFVNFYSFLSHQSLPKYIRAWFQGQSFRHVDLHVKAIF